MRIEEKESPEITYSVVIPVYNSEALLPELHHRLTKVMESIGEHYEIIFVEDCGPDNSWMVLKKIAATDSRVTVIKLMRNFGQGSATLCGISESRGSYIITLDDDLQHPPEELPKLISLLKDDCDLDVVMGVPLIKHHSLIRRLGSRLINQINSILLDKDPELRFTSFRVFRRSVADGLLSRKTIYPALGPLIVSVTRRISNVIIQHDQRKEGSSGYTFSKIVRQTLSNFIGYSMFPLRLLAVLGIIGIFACLFLSIFFFARYLKGGIGVPGWTTIILILITISGFNFFAYAILGEYVIRILQMVEFTPQYLIRNKINLSVMHSVQQKLDKYTAL